MYHADHLGPWDISLAMVLQDPIFSCREQQVAQLADLNRMRGAFGVCVIPYVPAALDAIEEAVGEGHNVTGYGMMRDVEVARHEEKSGVV